MREKMSLKLCCDFTDQQDRLLQSSRKHKDIQRTVKMLYEGSKIDYRIWVPRSKKTWGLANEEVFGQDLFLKRLWQSAKEAHWTQKVLVLTWLEHWVWEGERWSWRRKKKKSSGRALKEGWGVQDRKNKKKQPNDKGTESSKWDQW